MRRLLIATAIAAATAAIGQDSLREDASRLFGRIEAAKTTNTPEIELGRALYWDTRASIDGKTACATCHPASDWGADRRKFSLDARGALTSRHSPTIFNSFMLTDLRWLGDRKGTAVQAEGSITGSMGFASKEAGIAKLKELGYEDAFRKAYPNEPEPMSARNYGRAIAAYEATLTTPAAFDRYLAGDDKALSERQKSGLRAFIANGCAGCHSGALFGGTTFQKFGLVKDYWTETGVEKPDVGRFSMSKKDEDRYVFRVAPLRNVAKTAPYFHDGSVEKLDRAVQIMGAVQLGRTLDEKTTGDIVAFLESLTGEVPANYAAPGQRPAK